MTLDDALATLDELVHYDASPVYDLAPSIEALDCVKDEIAQLREVAIARTASTEALRQRAEAAEAEIARLRDGLRRIAENPMVDGDYVEETLWRRDHARALLAEDDDEAGAQ